MALSLRQLSLKALPSGSAITIANSKTVGNGDGIGGGVANANRVTVTLSDSIF